MKTWRDKALKRVADLNREAWYKKNHTKNGKRKYKKFRPYTVPDEAVELLDALNRNDELKAKRIFLYGWRNA